MNTNSYHDRRYSGIYVYVSDVTNRRQYIINPPPRLHPHYVWFTMGYFLPCTMVVRSTKYNIPYNDTVPVSYIYIGLLSLKLATVPNLFSYRR
jgi:hypothetical protein